MMTGNSPGGTITSYLLFTTYSRKVMIKSNDERSPSALVAHRQWSREELGHSPKCSFCHLMTKNDSSISFNGLAEHEDRHV